MAGKQKVYDEAMALAANYTWDQDWPNAIKSYRAALEEFPQDTAALTGLGMAYFELAQYESAVRALQRALQSDPANQDAIDYANELSHEYRELSFKTIDIFSTTFELDYM